MFTKAKAQLVPTVILLGEIAISGTDNVPGWLIGGLIGVTSFWLLWSIVFDRGLSRRFPALAQWFPFLDPHQEGLSAADLHSNFIRGRTFRIMELVGQDGQIHNRTFEDCVIIGPAVIAPSKFTSLYDCTYTCAPERFYWVLPQFQPDKSKTDTLPEGFVVLERCILRNCTLMRIGCLGTQKCIDKMKETVMHASGD